MYINQILFAFSLGTKIITLNTCLVTDRVGLTE